MLSHATFRRIIGEAPETRTGIVFHVICFGRLRQYASHGRMGEDVLEREVCPGFAVELGSPVR